MKKIIVILLTVFVVKTFAQNSYPSSGPATIASGQDQTLIIKDNRTGINWNYIEWQFNNGARDWVMGRQLTTGNFVLYKQFVGDVFTVDGSGNTWIRGSLGLNVAASEYSKLHLKSPTTSTWGMIVEANTSRRITTLGHNGSAGMIAVSTLDGSAGFTPLQFATSNQVRMTVDANGKVGIGTTSPASYVDIAGAGNANVDLKVNGRIQTGDAYGNGGIWLNNTSTMFVGQLGSSELGLFNGDCGLVLQNNGKIGIGTRNPDEKLTVNGKMHAQEVIIDLAVPAPDYVFEKSYDLKPLADVKKYIDENKHLPDVPSAKEMEKDGVKVGEMEMILLKKIEELTLYIIDLKSENTRVSETLRVVSQELSTLKRAVSKD